MDIWAWRIEWHSPRFISSNEAACSDFAEYDPETFLFFAELAPAV